MKIKIANDNTSEIEQCRIINLPKITKQLQNKFKTIYIYTHMHTVRTFVQEIKRIESSSRQINSLAVYVHTSTRQYLCHACVVPHQHLIVLFTIKICYFSVHYYFVVLLLYHFVS